LNFEYDIGGGAIALRLQR